MVRSTLLCIHRRLLLSVILGFFFSQVLLGQNAIVTENALPGNPISEWGVPNFRDNSIAGFATKMSLNRGETVRFKINVQSGASYTIKIYRIGYYGGNGARLMANLGSFNGTIQPNGNYNSSTGLLDCGNWSESANWAIPSSAVSGFYIAKLERSGGGSNHIAFIVRNDASNSDLYFQIPDATWQAYNGYGGNSLYDGTTSWPSGHAVKVSYNRPFFPYNSLFNTEGREADWYMNAEYPMIRWLERNGYDITYTGCNDVANNGSRLLNHRVFVTIGHDEYWSKGQRDNVEAARNAGIHMAFFTGNEVYWKTRWEDNNGSEDRTLVCYKEGLLGDGTIGERSCGTKCDPSTEWTGLWRTGGNYDAGRPENGLVGQISWVEYPTNITVPSAYKNLRFWRNSSIANLSSGQMAALGNNTLGYEWDYEQPAYASSYPAGRITMSSTTSNGVTHKLSLYRHSSGALVFGAGTVQWSWGLDGSHWGGSTTISPEIQQATVNLFADMGAQPGTLQSGLTAASESSDLTAPNASITSPASGATFSSGANITFSGSATDIGGGVIAAVEISTNGGNTWSQATFNAAASTVSWTYSWTANSDGTYNVKVRGVDDSGNIGNAGSGITITIGAGGDVTPPTVSAVSPLSGANGVSLTTSVTADFNESINPATVTNSSFQLKDASNNLVTATVGGSANAITLTPSAPLAASTLYTATIFGGSSGVKDVSGNALVNNYSWSFTTGTETAPPPSTLTINSFTTKTGIGAQAHALSGVPAGALLVLATTADAAPSNCAVSSTPSLTWTKRSDAGAAQSDNAEIWTATFAAGGSITVNSSWGTDHSQSSICYVVLNAESTLGGASATAVSQAAPSVTIITSRENSIIFGCTADFNARNGSNRTLRDNATERLYYRDGNYTTYHYTKSGQTVAAYTEGISSPSNQQASTALLEIRGVQSTPDITPPLVASVSPANAATGVATNSTVSVVFNEDMDANTINGSTIELRNSSSTLVSATVSYDVSSKTATLAPTGALTNSHTYSAKVKSGASGVKDASGNALANDYDWSFTTIVGDITPPTVSSVTPANGATGVLVGSTINAVFNEAMDASTINSSTIELRNSSSVLVPGTISYNAGTRTVMITPSAALANAQVYTATIKSGSAGVKDAAANALAADFIWSFTTETGDIIPPTVSSAAPTNGATGVLVGSTVSAVFSEAMDATTISGSTIELRNSSNVLVSATVSYNAITRTVTLTPSASLANSQLYTATIKSGASGVKDVSGNALAADYTWSFTTEAGDITPPTVTSVTPANGTAGVLVSSTITAVFSEAMNASTISGSTIELRNPLNVLVTATVSYNATTRTATLIPSGVLANLQVYTATIKSGATGVKDAAGNALAADYTWSFTTVVADVIPPTVTSVTPANAATSVSTNTTVTATFSEAINASTVSGTTFQLRDAGSNLVNATVSSSSNQITLTPAVSLAASTTYTATITGGASGVKDLSGNALASNYTWTFTTAAGGGTTYTVFQSSNTPAVPLANDGTGIELGMRFRSTQDGFINGIRYYKGSGTSGTHIGSLWTNTGTRLAQATFVNETASGWQQVLFSSPVAITANVTYVASYFSPSGDYAGTKPYFTQNIVNGPLIGLADGTDGANGVYRYTTTSAFPTGTFQSTNYWVDVVFAPGVDNVAPIVSGVSPASGATGVSINATITATFNEAINASTVTTTTFQLGNGAGNLVSATVNTASNQITLTPSAPLSTSTVYTVTIVGGSSGVKDPAGNALASNYSWSFTTQAGDIIPPTVTSVTPANGATSVNTNTPVTATFSEAINAATVNGTTFQLRDAGNNLVSATVSASSNQITLTPAVALAASTTYNVTIVGGASGVKDPAGNALASNYTWSFTTAGGAINCVINGFITSSFDNTTIPAGSYIWFNSSLDPGPLGAGTDPVTMNITNGVISFTANNVQYNVNVPNARVRFDASVTSASTQFINNVWETVVPRSYTSDVFMAGLSYPVPVNFPGNYMNVKWSANISIDKTGISVGWRWGAAVYSTFADHSGLYIKPINGATQNPYANLDRAGTPENFKAFVVKGAKGAGGTNYTGSFSAATVATCTINTGQRLPQQPLVVRLPDVSFEELAPGGTQSTPDASPLITSTNSIESEVYHYSLGQNYPNPLHKGTKIPFTIPIEEKVQLAVYDKSGKLVKMLVNGSQSAGKHIVNFNPGPLASGIYYYRIRAGEFTEVRKLIIR